MNLQHIGKPPPRELDDDQRQQAAERKAKQDLERLRRWAEQNEPAERNEPSET